jgi:hypothetical protein
LLEGNDIKRKKADIVENVTAESPTSRAGVVGRVLCFISVLTGIAVVLGALWHLFAPNQGHTHSLLGLVGLGVITCSLGAYFGWAAVRVYAEVSEKTIRRVCLPVAILLFLLVGSADLPGINHSAELLIALVLTGTLYWVGFSRLIRWAGVPVELRRRQREKGLRRFWKLLALLLFATLGEILAEWLGFISGTRNRARDWLVLLLLLGTVVLVYKIGSGATIRWLKDSEEGSRRNIKPLVVAIGILTIFLVTTAWWISHPVDREILKLKYAASPSTIGSAISALGEIGVADERVLPALVSALKDQGRWSVRNIGHSVGFYLRSEDVLIRQHAASALGEFGQDAKEAVPALIEMLNDERVAVRADVARALNKIEPDVVAKVAVPALIVGLTDENLSGRTKSVDVLGEIGPNAKAAVPTLIVLLENEDNRLRSTAANALGRIGPPASDAVPELIKLLKDDDAYVRSSSVDALNDIGVKRIPTTNTQAAVPALIELLDDEGQTAANRRHVRRSAVRVLGQIGPPARAAVPALMEMLTDDGRERRRRLIDRADEEVRRRFPHIRVKQTSLAREDSEIRETLEKIEPAMREELPEASGLNAKD